MSLSTKQLLALLLLVTVVSIGGSIASNHLSSLSDSLSPVISPLKEVFTPKVKAISEIQKYELKLNKDILAKSAKQIGIFSDQGVTLPGAEYAPPTVPQEQLHHIVKHLRVVLAYDNFYPLDEGLVDVVNEPVGGPAAQLVDKGETLEIKVRLHPKSLQQGNYTPEKLSIWISGIVTAYLNQIMGSPYEENLYLHEAELKAKDNTLPILVTEKT